MIRMHVLFQGTSEAKNAKHIYQTLLSGESQKGVIAALLWARRALMLYKVMVLVPLQLFSVNDIIGLDPARRLFYIIWEQ